MFPLFMHVHENFDVSTKNCAFSCAYMHVWLWSLLSVAHFISIRLCCVSVSLIVCLLVKMRLSLFSSVSWPVHMCTILYLHTVLLDYHFRSQTAALHLSLLHACIRIHSCAYQPHAFKHTCLPIYTVYTCIWYNARQGASTQSLVLHTCRTCGVTCSVINFPLTHRSHTRTTYSTCTHCSTTFCCRLSRTSRRNARSRDRTKLSRCFYSEIRDKRTRGDESNAVRVNVLEGVEQIAAAMSSPQSHSQNRLPPHLWILFLMLLISISLNPCSGACATTYLQSYPYRDPRPVSLTLALAPLSSTSPNA